MVGAIIGAAGTLAQTGANLWSSEQDRKLQERMAEEERTDRNKRIEAGQKYLDEVLQQLDTYHKGQTKYASPQMQEQYRQMIQNYDPNNFVYDFGSFEDQGGFDKSVEDYMDPYTNQIIEQAGQNVMAQYGKSGMGDSGFEQMAAFRKEAETLDELRKSAREEYQQDRDFAYKEYSDYITNMQNKYNQMANLTSTKINLMSGAIGHDETQESDYMSDLLAVQTNKASLGL